MTRDELQTLRFRRNERYQQLRAAGVAPNLARVLTDDYLAERFRERSLAALAACADRGRKQRRSYATHT